MSDQFEYTHLELVAVRVEDVHTETRRFKSLIMARSNHIYI